MIILLLSGCTNNKELDVSMKPVTNYKDGLKCKCTTSIFNLIDKGIVTKVDMKNKSITIKHENGIISVIENMEQINPVLNFNKNKMILKGYVVGIANENTTYKRIKE